MKELALGTRTLVSTLAVFAFSSCTPIQKDQDASLTDPRMSDAGPIDDAAVPIENDPEGPTIKVLSPEPAGDGKAPVIARDSVEVRCQVKPRGRQGTFDTSSVKAHVFLKGQDTPLRSLDASPSGLDTYQATLSLLDLAHGELRVGCSANDLNTRSALAWVDIMSDRGPEIALSGPLDGSAVARYQKVLVRFDARENPLFEGDTAAQLDSVELTINGRTVEPTRTGQTYEHLVDLSDTATFPVSSSALEVEVRAKNRRAPDAGQRTVRSVVAIDGQSPEIRVRTPEDATYVGQRMRVEAQISDDASGLDPATVRATVTIDGKTDVYPLTPGPREEGTEDVFVGHVNTGRYLNRAQLTVNIIAKDKAGNEGRIGRVVSVDSVAPWVSLDPPPVRVRKKKVGAPGYECSAPLDPVGKEATGDLARVTSPFSLYRAVVWERGIELRGQSLVNVSRVKDGSVSLWVQENDGTQLLVDTDGDGSCDDILENPDPQNPSLAPVKVPLSPPTAGGETVAGSGTESQDPAISGSICTASDVVTDQIAPLCADTTLTYVLRHEAPSIGPVIYGLTPSAPRLPGCVGVQWQGTGKSGWACVVATAEDEQGNLGISQPLRVCYDLDGKGCEGEPPTCHAGCTLPESITGVGMPRFVDNSD